MYPHNAFTRVVAHTEEPEQSPGRSTRPLLAKCRERLADRCREQPLRTKKRESLVPGVRVPYVMAAQNDGCRAEAQPHGQLLAFGEDSFAIGDRVGGIPRYFQVVLSVEAMDDRE